MMFAVITALPLFVGGVFADPASSLSAALAQYPSLSSFRQLVGNAPSVFDTLIPINSVGVTVLAPSNQAIQSYTSKHGPLRNLSTAALKDILSYHVLVAPVTSANFTSPRGLTIPTMLAGTLFNNRTAGADLTTAFGPNATGQVLFIQQQLQASVGRVARQSLGTTNVQLQAGLAETANITVLDAPWSLGYFHMVDT